MIRAQGKDAVTEAVERDFAELERGAASHPGLNDLLVAYGQQLDVVKQAEDYLAILNPPASFSTSDSSS